MALKAPAPPYPIPDPTPEIPCGIIADPPPEVTANMSQQQLLNLQSYLAERDKAVFEFAFNAGRKVVYDALADEKSQGTVDDGA
jgi:alpha/beta superfamily hydrolase